VRTIAAYVADWYKGGTPSIDLLWSRAAGKLENEYRLALMAQRAQVLKSVSPDAGIKLASAIVAAAGGSNSPELINLVEKSFRAPAMKVDLLRRMDTSNYSLEQLIASVRKCTLVKSAFDVPFQKSEDKTRFELDTVPLSVLSFTKVPVKDPMLNFKANFGSAFSVKGPPVNKPKDPFGFNF